MAQFQERMVPVRRGAFNVQLVEGGAGPALVYLHGAGGFTGWTPFLERLGQQYRVYAPAHPGVAGSTGLERLDDLWDLTLFYEELLQALGLERVFLVGHSYGGMVAAELAAQVPERVRRLALVASLGLWLDETPVADFFVLTPTERAEMLWHNPRSPAAQAWLTPPKDAAAKLEADLGRTQTLAAVGKFVWPIPERGLTKRLHRITMPTLLVWGDSDRIVPPAYGAAFQRLLPNATLTVIPHCGHLPQEERPEELVQTLGRFFQD